ncbi:MAG: HAD family hydrolase, partial [Bdellovibrionales bacterium]
MTLSMPIRPELHQPLVIIYDLDGTLKDSIPRIAKILTQIGAKRGLPPVSLEMAATATAYGYEGGREIWGISADENHEIQAEFAPLFFQEDPAVQPMPGANEFVARVPAAVRQAIFTNCVQNVAVADVMHLGMAKRIPIIVGRGVAAFF